MVKSDPPDDSEAQTLTFSRLIFSSQFRGISIYLFSFKIKSCKIPSKKLKHMRLQDPWVFYFVQFWETSMKASEQPAEDL